MRLMRSAALFSLLAVVAACGVSAQEESSPLLQLPEASTEGWNVGAPPNWATLDHDVEVTFWHAIAQAHEAALNEIIESFQASHPHITVRPTYMGAYQDLHTALFAALSTQSRPVLTQMYESWTSEFLEQRLVVPLQVFVDAEGASAEAELADYFPSFLDNNRWGDVLVTLPFNKSVYLLFVNQDLLDAAGLSIPQTWEEMRQAAVLTTNRDENRYGFGVRPIMETFTPLFLMNGGEYVIDGRLNLESPESKETLQLLIDMTHHDQTAFVESNYLTTAFGQGSVAMFTGSSAGLPYTETAVAGKFRWTVAPLPTHGDHPRRVLSQGTNVGLITGHDPEVEWAAWEFVKYLTNAENSAGFAQASGYLPVRRSSLRIPAFQQFLEQNPNLAVATSQLEFAAFEPRVPIWETIRNTLNRQIGQMLTNPSADAESRARRMTREAEDDLEE
jgi:multiple sugar transport system substrate-binding protein